MRPAWLAVAAVAAVAAGLVSILPGFVRDEAEAARQLVRVETEVRPDSVRLGDPVTLRYRVWLPDGAEVHFPSQPADDSTHHWQGWKVETLRGKGGREHRLTATFLPFALGGMALPGVPVRFRIRGEEPREGRFPTAQIVIVPTVPTRGPEPELRDLKPLVPPPWWALVPWGWIALGLGVLAILLLVVRYFLRRRPRRAMPSIEPALELPEVEALRRLGALVARRLPEEGRTLEHGTELADLLRRYVERRFGGLEPGYTSSEVVRTLLGRSEAGKEEVLALRGIFDACDLTKFARRPYDATRAHEAEKTAAHLIEEWTPKAEAAGLEPEGPGTPGTPPERRGAA